MEVTFKNHETNHNITLKSDKSLMIVYGKNGSGKTTLSRSNCFDKKFVFSEDFIFSNVYNINDNGASQTTITKENFSGLWLGEDIVKIRKEISSLLVIEKKIKDEFQIEQISLMSFFNNNQLPVDFQSKIRDTLDKEFVLDLEKIQEQKEKFNTNFKFKTSILNKEHFKEKLIYFKKNDIYNMLISKIKNNKLLSELIFLEKNEYISTINNKILMLHEQKSTIDEIEKIFKEENITVDLSNKIREWYELHQEKDKCLFCGNTNITEAMNKWKKVFLNKHIDCKNKLIQELKQDLDFCKRITNEKQFIEVDKDIIDMISELIVYLKELIDNIVNNKFNNFNFKVKFVKKEIIERNELIDNLVNYVFEQKKNIIGFYYNAQLFIEKLKKEKLLLTDKLMDEKGVNIADDINEKFKKFGLNKNIKIIVDKRSTPHKFTYSIKNHDNINELSDGQKHKLALAIFMNYLEEQDLDNKTIVIDDPVVSLDISSYILFKQYLLNDLIKKHFKKNTKLILLTHDITYLYIQVSNIFENSHMRAITQIFKLNGEEVEDVPLDFIKTDDITLFRDALDNVSNLTELRILNAIINKIFRIEIDLKLRFFGKSYTDGIGIGGLPYDELQKDKLNEYKRHIVQTSRREHPSDSDIQQSLIFLKETSEMLGFNEFVTNAHIFHIDKIVKEQIDGPIQYDLFKIIESVQKFLRLSDNQDFKHYIEHTRNSYTRNIIGLGLEDYYN